MTVILPAHSLIKEAVREGAEPPQRASSLGSLRGAGKALQIDAGGDRFELADSLAQVGNLDPAGRGGKVAIAGVVGQLEALEVEPAIPRLEPGPARGAEAEDDAGAQQSDR